MAYLGIDIGGTRLKAGFVSREGQIIARRTVPTPTNLQSFKGVVNKIAAELIERNGTPEGVGIGCKGIVNPATTVVEILPGTFQFLENQQLSSLVQPLLPEGARVMADNDARVALVGEMVWGAARGRQNVVMLTLGTGVGGAVVAEGKILRGVRGVAGHLGHITIEPQGRVCYCGNRGCLETVFSARAIEAEALHSVYRGCESLLTERFAAHPQQLTCQAVFETAAEDDPIAVLIRDTAIEKLGAAIAGLLHVFDSELVIVGGQISEIGAALFDPLKREVGWRTRRLLNREVSLVPTQVADASGVVGAAGLVVAGET